MTFILGLILGAATLIFVFQNMVTLTVSFLSWQITGNLTVILVLCVLIGMVISWLFSLPELLQLGDLSRTNRKLAKELDEKKLKLSETEGKLSQAQTPVILDPTSVQKIV